MNKNILYIAVFGVLCVMVGMLAGVTIAGRGRMMRPVMERPGFGRGPAGFMGHGLRQGSDGRRNGPVEMLSARLKLNKEQQEKVARILEDTRKEIERTGRNIRNSIIDIREKADKQIMGILTPPQQEEFKVLQEEFVEARVPGKGRGRALPPPEDEPPLP